jgi:putative hydrolase of the HAD superfamily
MPIRAVVFDIGGVLEDTPAIGVAEKWEAALRLRPGELNERLGDFEDNDRAIADIEAGLNA